MVGFPLLFRLEKDFSQVVEKIDIANQDLSLFFPQQICVYARQ